MSTNLNTLSEKVGEVNRAVQTALGNASVAMDGALQTLHRQKHLSTLIERLANKEVTQGELISELQVIAGRCPSIKASQTYIQEHYTLIDIVKAETLELYELVEKLRGLEAASVNPYGAETESF